MESREDEEFVSAGTEEGGAEGSGKDLTVSSEKKEDVAGSALVVLWVEGNRYVASEEKEKELLVGDCGGSGRSLSMSRVVERLMCGGAM
jgi:hypothetical protein